MERSTMLFMGIDWAIFYVANCECLPEGRFCVTHLVHVLNVEDDAIAQQARMNATFFTVLCYEIEICRMLGVSNS